MSNVNSYSNSQPVVGSSKFLGSDALGETVNYEASDVASYVLGSATTITNKTGSYTIALSDLNTFMQYATNGGTITGLASTDTTYPIGGETKIQFTVAGTCSVVAGSGCTLTGSGSFSSQYQVKTLKRVSASVWTIF